MKLNKYIKRPKGDKPTPVIFSIHYGSQRIRFYTGDLVKPSEWDTKKQKHKKRNQLNVKLSEWESWIEQELDKYQAENKEYPNPISFKKHIESHLWTTKSKTETEKARKDTFPGYFELLIKRSEEGLRQPNNKPIAPATIQVYKRTLQTLEEFSTQTGYKLDFDTLNITFYDKFVEYLTKKNYSNNTIGKYLRFVKVVANDAKESGYQVNDFVKSKKFHVRKQENIDRIYLTPSQIDEIIDLDLNSNPTLDRLRDLFVIQCKSALRYSDIQTLSEKNISGDFILIGTVKTKQRLHIPIVPEIRRIIEKYHGGFPIPLSNPRANKYLKDLGQLIPSLKENFEQTIIKGGVTLVIKKMKWELLTTHTGRRSYCTNAYLAGVPLQDIMRVSGHKTEKSFRIYLRHKDLEHIVINMRGNRNALQDTNNTGEI